MSQETISHKLVKFDKNRFQNILYLLLMIILAGCFTLCNVTNNNNCAAIIELMLKRIRHAVFQNYFNYVF